MMEIPPTHPPQKSDPKAKLKQKLWNFFNTQKFKSLKFY